MLNGEFLRSGGEPLLGNFKRITIEDSDIQDTSEENDGGDWIGGRKVAVASVCGVEPPFEGLWLLFREVDDAQPDAGRRGAHALAAV